MMNSLGKILSISGLLFISGCNSISPVRSSYATSNSEAIVRVKGAIDDVPAAYAQAKKHLIDGYLQQAIKGFELILATDPGHVDAKNGIAVVLAKSGQPDAAIAVLTKAIEAHPLAIHLRNNLGFTLYKAERYVEAESVFQTALALDPKNLPVIENLGLVKAQLLLISATESVPKIESKITPQERRVGDLEKTGDNLYTLIGPEIPQVPTQVERVVPAVLVARIKSAPEIALREVRVLIVNGNGYRGQAKRYRGALKNKGFTVSRTVNAAEFNHRTSRIEYLSGFEKQAKALSQLMPGGVVLKRVNHVGNSDVRLILGHDLRKIRI